MKYQVFNTEVQNVTIKNIQMKWDQNAGLSAKKVSLN